MLFSNARSTKKHQNHGNPVLSSNVRRWGTVSARRALSFVLPFFALPPTPPPTHTHTHGHTLTHTNGRRAHTPTQQSNNINRIFRRWRLTEFFNEIFTKSTKHLKSRIIFAKSVFNKFDKKKIRRNGAANHKIESNCKLQCLFTKTSNRSTAAITTTTTKQHPLTRRSRIQRIKGKQQKL